MYACTATRPDIAFALHELTHFLNNPGITHWNAAIRVVCYLHTTKDWSLTYGWKKELDWELETPPEGYVDADGQMAEDRKAVTGWIFMIDGGAVSWSSHSQTLVSLSTADRRLSSSQADPHPHQKTPIPPPYRHQDESWLRELSSIRPRRQSA